MAATRLWSKIQAVSSMPSNLSSSSAASMQDDPSFLLTYKVPFQDHPPLCLIESIHPQPIQVQYVDTKNSCDHLLTGFLCHPAVGQSLVCSLSVELNKVKNACIA
ncbi:predicted protein [Lichtheimia corymbifera JMRC:FSU:9682]|uniref:Uncharacterized protein n=1 Tax=Lichtheimia corymbifera JMRC:FSU:9682 TaxID=1263082 RepID=A0A068SC67_9FUNG|nr:predicted protein [Lichtheimia corymbifera JMRC:FSU:9682]